MKFTALKSLILMTVVSSIAPMFMGLESAAEAKPMVQAFRHPSTPFLPPYTGRIVAGDYTTVPQADGGVTYLITFEAAEQPHQVLNWYKSAFQNYSWSVDAQQPAQYKLVAQHGSNVESNIFLLAPRKPGAGVQVQLYYRYIGKEI